MNSLKPSPHSTFNVRCARFTFAPVTPPAARASPFQFPLSVFCFLLFVGYASAATRYVWQDSPSPGPPYDTWANAAHVIQDAVDAAAAGDEIVVTNGLYATGGRAVGTNVLVNRVAVDKPLTLRSVNGPEFTIIHGAKAPGGGNGDGAIRCVYLTDGASLGGFTLTNGATRLAYDYPTYHESGGGGIWCESTNVVVSNCVLTGNSAQNGGGAFAGTLNNCTLMGNPATYGGGACGGTLYDCTLTGNLVYGDLPECGGGGGGGAYGSMLYNCTLTGNAAYGFVGELGVNGRGGGAFDCTLYNCTLISNRVETLYYPCSLLGGGADSCTLYNCTLIGNSAAGFWGYGGGAYECMLYNCTLSGNSANWGGGGALGGTLNNCIVYFNTAANGANYFTGSNWWGEQVATLLNYCCTTPLPPNGVGNITNAPLFVDTNGWSDLRLRADSPCIDAGTNLTGIVSTDILGLPRPMDGDGDGVARFDIGAHEFNPYRFEPAPQLSACGLLFTVSGEPGRSVRIERSRDLVNWELAAVVPVPVWGQTLIDPAATTGAYLFYRALREP